MSTLFLYSTLFLSLLCSTTIPECTLALLSFTVGLHSTEYAHKMEKKKRRYETEAYNQKLKLSGFNSVFQTRMPEIRLGILETNSCIFIFYLHFVCMFFSFFLLQLLCTNMKKVAVQPSLQYKQAETRDKNSVPPPPPKKKKKNSGLNKTKLAFRGEMSPASEISLPEVETDKCCLCKVYKVDIFQTNVTSIRRQKWATETGHIITVSGQTQSCSCLQLLELY